MKYIVSRKNKFVCHLVPKCATRSLLRYFNKDKHTSRAWFTRGYFRFAFIRDPYSRVVSTYLNKIKNNYREDVGKILKPHGMYPDMPFEEFVETICFEWDSEADEHWKSQYLFTKGVDFIGTIENLDKDFQTVCDRIGIENNGLGRYNYTTNDGGWHIDSTQSKKFVNWKKYYSPYTLSLVRNRYEKDIELYKRVTSRR